MGNRETEIRRVTARTSSGVEARSGEVTRLLAEGCITRIRREVEMAEGREVLFLARREGNRGPFTEIRVTARGSRGAVPAIMASTRPGDAVIHNHPSGNLAPSEADLQIASLLGDEGMAFIIVNNDATQANCVVEPPVEEDMVRPLEVERVLKALGPEGPMAAAISGFEPRPGQIRMAEAVCRALNLDGIQCLEAGTGTGKGMAYLVPAVAWLRENRERILISTGTINLQEQLFTRDIPMVLKAMGEDFSVCMVKGRSNYLCLRRLATALSSGTDLFGGPEAEALQALSEWADGGGQALQDLGFQLPDSLWSEVCSDADFCARVQCRHNERCPFYLSRRKAAAARILVANHHILLADITVRRSTGNYKWAALLPLYRRVMIDEAHHLEEAAGSFLGVTVTQRGVISSLRRLQRREKGKGPRGLLAAAAACCRNNPALSERLTSRMPLLVEKAEASVEAGFESVREWCELTLHREGAAAVGKENAPLLPDGSQSEAATARRTKRAPPLHTGARPHQGGEINLRLTPPRAGDTYHDLVVEPLEGSIRHLAVLVGEIGQTVEEYREGLPKDGSETAQGVASELGGVCRRLTNAVKGMRLFLEYDPACTDRDPWVRWIERRPVRRGAPSIKLHCVQVEVGQELAEALFDKVPSVVLTSATLTANNSFEYVKNRLGLDRVMEERVEEAVLPSPFDYARQSLVVIPSDMPDPRSRDYPDACARVIFQALQITGGGAFVLFTSLAMLDRVHQRLRRPLQACGLVPLRQGDAGRTLLLERFRQEEGAVLFGSDSFWEGVDVPGDTLRSVIITRLPFKVPNHPLLEARAEAIEASGENPFLKMTVPQAVIKLKQGFGRLIRTKTDRGSVLILDSRSAQKSYGKKFLNSLPDGTPVVVEPEEVAMEMLARFHSEFKPGN